MKVVSTGVGDACKEGCRCIIKSSQIFVREGAEKEDDRINNSSLPIRVITLSGHSASYHRAETAAAAATTVLNARKKKKNSFTATSTRRSQRTSTRTTSATYSSQQRIGSGREPCLPLIGGHAIPMVKAQVMSSREEYALDIRHGAKVDLCKC